MDLTVFAEQQASAGQLAMTFLPLVRMGDSSIQEISAGKAGRSDERQSRDRR